MLLYPRHLLALLKRPLILATFVATLLGSAALGIAAVHWEWSTRTILVVSVVMLAVIVATMRVVEGKLSE